MKSAVIYFSLTGNTEKVATAICSGIEQITGQCDLLKLKDANPRNLYEYDLIGLGFLIVHFVEPLNVRRFVNEMFSMGGKHIFLFATHATTWHYAESLAPRLKKKGMVLIGHRDWYGHSNGPLHFPAPYFTDNHPDEWDLKEAETFGREMVEHSYRISGGETGLIPPEPEPYTVPQFVHDEFADVLSWKKMAHLNREKCLYPACRLCMDNCLMNGIDLSVDPPVFANPCTSCHFCGQICPTGAIELDEERLWGANRTIAEKVNEIFIPRVRRAIEEGTFRMLVKEEEIGWDTPLFKIFKGSPKWIIGKGRPDTPSPGIQK